MRIAVHARVLGERQLNGIGVYTYNLLKSIAVVDKENEYALYSNRPMVHKIRAENFHERVLNFPKLWSYLRLPFEFINEKYDLLFIPKEMVPFGRRPKTVVTCYDFGRLIDPKDRISFDAKIHFWLASHYALRAAEKIIAISESTKKDIVKYCGISPNKITVTPLGYDSELNKPCQDQNLIRIVKEKYGLKEKYIINTSGILWTRKNLLTLIKAFQMGRLRGRIDHQLIITGRKGEAYEEVVKLIDSLKLAGKVILAGYIPEEDMPVLLSGAEALTFPSLYEGFGLVLLEAMACGCPVITSNCSAMPEVVGDAGILVNPYNEEEIVCAIERVLTDAELKKQMVEKGLQRAKLYSWEKTARETLKVFENLQ